MAAAMTLLLVGFFVFEAESGGCDPNCTRDQSAATGETGPVVKCQPAAAATPTEDSGQSDPAAVDDTPPAVGCPSGWVCRHKSVDNKPQLTCWCDETLK